MKPAGLLLLLLPVDVLRLARSDPGFGAFKDSAPDDDRDWFQRTTFTLSQGPNIGKYVFPVGSSCWSNASSFSVEKFSRVIALDGDSPTRFLGVCIFEDENPGEVLSACGAALSCRWAGAGHALGAQEHPRQFPRGSKQLYHGLQAHWAGDSRKRRRGVMLSVRVPLGRIKKLQLSDFPRKDLPPRVIGIESFKLSRGMNLRFDLHWVAVSPPAYVLRPYRHGVARRRRQSRVAFGCQRCSHVGCATVSAALQVTGYCLQYSLHPSVHTGLR